MTKKIRSARASRFFGYATMGRTAAVPGSMADLRIVDVRIGVPAMHPAPPSGIPASLLSTIEDARHAAEGKRHTIFLDELPNAATSPGWHDGDGHYHAPLGEAGVAALRRMFEDRLPQHGYRIPAPRA